jgi:hypothetical protein
MKSLIIISAVALILLCLGGCIQVRTLIKLNSNGSGIIEETVLMSKEIFHEMESMTNQMTGEMNQMMGHADESSVTELSVGSFDLFNEDELRNKVAKWGEGVSYVFGRPITTEKYEGYKAFYAFTDINKIKIDKDQSESMPTGIGGPEMQMSDNEEYITFQFTQGSPSTLVIKQPVDMHEKASNSMFKKYDSNQPNDPESEMMMAQMKQLFKGLKFAMEVQVPGTIVHTTATHSQDSNVTLVELDFGKLLEMPEYFEKFSRYKPQGFEDAIKIMKDIPGVKLELKEKIQITFK